jgi:hypothetical protein
VVLNLLSNMTQGLDAEAARIRIGTVMHGQEANAAIFALLQHREQFEALIKRLDAADPALLARDFQTAFEGPITTVRLFNENLVQAARTIGEGFTPTMSAFSTAIGLGADLLKGANQNFPILTTAAYTAAGALAALAAAAGAKSLVGDYVAAGGRLLLGAVGGTAGAAAAGVGLLSAEYARFLSDYIMRHKDDYPNAAPPPELRLHITADPGLQVHRLGTGGEKMTIGSPLGWADPQNRVLGRE